MLIEIERIDDFTYTYKKKRINLREMGNMIREGHVLKVEDGYANYTKEVLVRIALEGYLTKQIPGKRSNDFNLVDILADVIDEEKLLTIIENGGIDNYMLKKARGFKL
jgi:hypothetical protein